VRRRRFDHLAVELSVEVGRAVPRWALWTALHDQGQDPEDLSAPAAVAFCDGPLDAFLRDQGLTLGPRRTRRLRRRVARYDPRHPPPEEIFACF
jgi:hypothetical protein